MISFATLSAAFCHIPHVIALFLFATTHGIIDKPGIASDAAFPAVGALFKCYRNRKSNIIIACVHAPEEKIYCFTIQRHTGSGDLQNYLSFINKKIHIDVIWH
jgi:hypothetical protein